MSSNFTSYFETGYMIRGEGHKDFQSNYVTVYSKVDEQDVVNNYPANVEVVDSDTVTVRSDTDASCWMYGKWDWAKRSASNMYNTVQQVYNATDRPHRAVQKRKLKVRGSGAALNLRFESEDGKPFHIIGWSTYDTVKQNV